MSNFALQPLHVLSKCLSERTAWVVVLVTVGWLSGRVPGLSHDFSRVTLTSEAHAQNQLQIARYAQTVLQIEPLRIKTRERIQIMMGRTVPGDLCHRERLRSDVRKVCDDYHNRSAKIIRSNNLTLWEFNQITWKSQHQPWLKNKIQQELLRQRRR